MLKKIILYIFFFCGSYSVSFCQKIDTLHEVLLQSKNVATPVKNATPVQSVSKDFFENKNSVADVLTQFAGVQIKDYGGVGGLKTISVRSLGANHTGVLYDGIIISDAQAGQIDLGKFSLDNINEIELANANTTNILLPAKAFSYASLLSIKTNESKIEKGDLFKLIVKQGSFQNYSAAIKAQKKLKKYFTTGISAWYEHAKNEYPFVSYENKNKIEKRANSAVATYRLEFDANYTKSTKTITTFKVFYYTSLRELPGAIILYNNNSKQTLKDNNFFVQSTLQQQISSNHFLLFSLKYASDKSFYTDPQYLNAAGRLETNFIQKEIYASAAYKYIFSKPIEIGISADAFNSTLVRQDSFVSQFASPNRNTFLQNIAFKYHKSNIEVNANLLHTNIIEKVKYGYSANDIQNFSPAFSLSWKPFSKHFFYTRAFFKKIFRSPTFNDLYYTNIGNINLKPELAQQYNVGVTYQKNFTKQLEEISFTIDGYINKVKDKILAVPRQNLFQWSIQNIGAVNIKGIDAALHITFNQFKKIKSTINFSYTFQKTIDISNPNDAAFNTQLPYTPVHSGSSSVYFFYKKFTTGYQFFFSSNRYRQGDVIADNRLPAWSSQDVSLTYKVSNCFKIIAAANNIFNTQYEIIKYYPMPRFNYYLSLHFHF